MKYLNNILRNWRYLMKSVKIRLKNWVAVVKQLRRCKKYAKELEVANEFLNKQLRGRK